MRRLPILLAPAAALAACASGPETQGLGHGVASYDALRAASAECEARGGHVEPRGGTDGRDLADYACVIPPKGR